MGMWMATLVIGNGRLGIFLLPAVTKQQDRSRSLLVFTGIGAMLLARLRHARRACRTGGPYVYARKAFGDFIGFQTAWSYWINAWVGNAAIAIAFAGYLTVFWGDASKNWIAVVVAISLVWILTFANILGVREAGRIQVVTTVLKFVPLLVIGVVGLFFMDTGNFDLHASSGFDWGISGAACSRSGPSSDWSRRPSLPRRSRTLSGPSLGPPSSARRQRQSST
jgi:APA family basic amino acid/polyamine antiporter